MKGVHFDRLNPLSPAKDRNVNINGNRKYAEEKAKNVLKICQTLYSTKSFGFATRRKSNYLDSIFLQFSNDACKALVKGRLANAIFLFTINHFQNLSFS